MRTIFLSILFVTAIFSSSVFSQVAGYQGLNPLSGRWVVSAEGGVTYAKTDFRNSLIDHYARVMGEYFLPTKNSGIFGLRVKFGLGRLKGSGGVSNYPIDEFKTQISEIGGGIDFTLAASDEIFPYVYAGVSYLFFDPKDKHGNRLPNNTVKKYSRQEWSLQGELGIRFLLSTDLSLNLNGTIFYEDTDELDDVIAGRDNDVFFTILGGLSFYFGGVKDTDKDGVRDEDDACLETPQGVKVNEFGCAIDTDADGVPDYLDRCPQTPANIIVDASGCPIDTDDDGVPDYLDQCSNTPPNVSVDRRGCPFDEDGDGVPDYKDNCPGTSPGTEVDRFGCPLKSQEKKLPETTKLMLSGEVNFKTGKSDLLPGAKLKLDKLNEVLKNYPNTKWRIEGHTDNTGSFELNMRLSEKRAISVADYLIMKGIETSRLEVIGFGPDYPIADNSTESGRSLNRRVSVEMIDEVGEYDRSRERKTFDADAEYNKSAERNIGNMIFTDGRLYCYQVSSWRSYDKAVREVDRLQARGENAFIMEATNIPGIEGTWYRVRIGYFKSLSEARDHQSRSGY